MIKFFKEEKKESWLHRILSFSLSKLVFLGVIGEILFTGGLKGMVSLTLGLTTMRSRVLRTLYFLGRVFGNQRFLSS